MKTLHLVSGEISSGAARGAYWLHQGLLEHGVDSHVLTTSKETYGDTTVTTLAANKKGKLGVFFRQQVDANLQVFYPNRQKVIFSTGLVGYDFTRHPEYNQADIIHLHWVCAGMVNMRHLAKIKKPLVWTMRDMWPMTGGCHYTMECSKYMTGCGKCPQLGSRRTQDLSWLIFRRKRKSIQREAKMVGISHWVSDCARQSALFHDFDVRTIHNNVSPRDFFPVEKYVARQMMGIDQDKSVILAGAQNMESFYKGFTDYLQALNDINSDVLLLFFGKLDQSLTASLKSKFISLGFLYDTVSLRLAYSAADVFVAPSRMDAFGKTLAESLACGTPVVCYDATGPKDIVDHKVNGYKAMPFESEDLARGIEWVLGHPEPERLAQNAREKVLRNFDSNVVASQYISLYEEILSHR